MTKVLSIPVDEDVCDILPQRSWLGKVYKVSSFQPVTRNEVYDREGLSNIRPQELQLLKEDITKNLSS